MAEKNADHIDVNRTFLLKMDAGDMISYKKGSLIEIHKVVDGWIHVFQLCNSQLTTQFVPDNTATKNVELRGAIRT